MGFNLFFREDREMKPREKNNSKILKAIGDSEEYKEALELMKITSFFFISMFFIVKAKNKVKRINKIVPLAKQPQIIGINEMPKIETERNAKISFAFSFFKCKTIAMPNNPITAETTAEKPKDGLSCKVGGNN